MSSQYQRTCLNVYRPYGFQRTSPKRRNVSFKQAIHLWPSSICYTCVCQQQQLEFYLNRACSANVMYTQNPSGTSLYFSIYSAVPFAFCLYKT